MELKKRFGCCVVATVRKWRRQKWEILVKVEEIVVKSKDIDQEEQRYDVNMLIYLESKVFPVCITKRLYTIV